MRSQALSGGFLFASALMMCIGRVPAYGQASPGPALITSTEDDSARVALLGNVHPMARTQFDRGEAPGDLKLDRLVLILKRGASQEAALQKLIEEQQNKGSSEYHHWLTPEQVGAQFGPAQSDVEAITGWLQASGFAVSQISKTYVH